MIPERDDIIYDINQFSPSKHSFIYLEKIRLKKIFIFDLKLFIKKAI